MASVTDGDKEEVAYYEYDAWGNIMTEAGTWRSPYCFSTRERDYGIEDGDYEYNSGLIYFGARYYSAEMGRWTQRDPLGTVDGLNLYLYVNNEPANGMDPWGLQDPSAMAGLFRKLKPLPPGQETACSIYVFACGVPGGVQHFRNATEKLDGKRSGGEGAAYYIAYYPAPNESKVYAYGPEGGVTKENVIDRWRKKWGTWQYADGKLAWGNAAGKSCCDANCGDIRSCLDAAPGAFEKAGDYSMNIFSPHSCYEFISYGLEKCCLRKGHLLGKIPLRRKGPARRDYGGPWIHLDEPPWNRMRHRSWP